MFCGSRQGKLMRAHYGHAVNLVAITIFVFGVYFLFASLPTHPTSVVDEFGALPHHASQEMPPPKPAYNAALLPQLSPGQQINFGTGKDNRALISGWNAPEPGGVWSKGHTAAIGFSVHCQRCVINDPVLLLSGDLLLLPEHPSQIMKFWVRGKNVDTLRLSMPPNSFAVQLGNLTISDGNSCRTFLSAPKRIHSKR